MIENQKNPIKKALPATRDPVCYQTQHAIIIPKGTILRQQPGAPGVFDCPVAHGTFTVDAIPALEHADTYKRVVA